MVDTTLSLKEYKKKSRSYVKDVMNKLLLKAEETKIQSKANTYAKRAKKISLATRVPIPSHQKRRICKKCSAFLVPQKSATFRTQRGKVVITCKACKHMTRIPYTQEKKAKRSTS